MTSGSVANANKSRRWRAARIAEGSMRVTLWLKPELAKRLINVADRDIVPYAVAAETILKRHFEGEI